MFAIGHAKMPWLIIMFSRNLQFGDIWGRYPSIPLILGQNHVVFQGSNYTPAAWSTGSPFVDARACVERPRFDTHHGRGKPSPEKRADIGETNHWGCLNTHTLGYLGLRLLFLDDYSVISHDAHIITSLHPCFVAKSNVPKYLNGSRSPFCDGSSHFILLLQLFGSNLNLPRACPIIPPNKLMIAHQKLYLLMWLQFFDPKKTRWLDMVFQKFSPSFP